MASVADENSDILTFTPLGSGQEVGRSCHFMQFKGKKIMFDCGIHPGMHGVDALPFVDFIDCEDLDLLLVTHFHLDHAGALPWLLEKTAFRGRCFMTHATKAIYRMLIGDYIKIAKYGGGSEHRMLYTEEDLERSMDKIEVIDFHEQKEVNGIKFWCYVAGHVLGACMFMVEIAGIRVLYTGDFSRLEDRHLCAAEIPNITPDVLISESTYGTQIHESREDRERRFTSTVHEIVARGGRCLTPAFALGRAQELLLILDEYWEQHPELHEIPVYYASSLAKKCMAVYQTFVSGMNQKIQRQIAVNNPFVFKHVSNLKVRRDPTNSAHLAAGVHMNQAGSSMEHFEDIGPCVVLASPGMLQNGLSRELFENWCTDSKNGCLIAGYCVEGTLAKHILSEPEEIISMSGQKLPMRLQVAYISFSAHTDFAQTSEFVRAIKPPHLILVHGEMNEMNRLKAGILRQYEDDQDFKIEVHNPRNTETVALHFRGQKTAKVVGNLALNPPQDSSVISGVLVRRNFNYHLMHPNDLSAYTDLANSRLTQRESLYYDGTLPLLLHNLRQLTAELQIEDGPQGTKDAPTHVIKMFKGAITLFVHVPQKVIVLDWMSNPVNDMYSDAVMAAVLHAQTNPIPDKILPKFDPDETVLSKRITALHKVLRDINGKEAQVAVNGTVISVEVDGKTATVDSDSLHIACDDQLLQHLISSVCHKIASTLATVP
ncbi:hypothetical protein AAVH_28828 [Aphelenchoides avenae]|nr:hypothetical protein AAVH_28828 [Aphelenchus avenae]